MGQVLSFRSIRWSPHGSTGALELGQLGGPGLNPARPNVYTPTPGKIYSIDLYYQFAPGTGEPAFGSGDFVYSFHGGAQRLPVSLGSGINFRSRNYVPVNTLIDTDSDGQGDTPYL